jgi:SSS family solute:Na+ symporter
VAGIVVPLIVGVLTTMWFMWGDIRDLRRMFAALRTIRRDTRDDGFVVGERNLDEADEGEAPAPVHDAAAE